MRTSLPVWLRRHFTAPPTKRAFSIL
jgi:hypothetical protein